jgi:hypothetical protein
MGDAGGAHGGHHVGFDTDRVPGLDPPTDSSQGFKGIFNTLNPVLAETDGDGCTFLRHGILLTTPEKMQHPNKSVKNGQ